MNVVEKLFHRSKHYTKFIVLVFNVLYSLILIYTYVLMVFLWMTKFLLYYRVEFMYVGLDLIK